MTQDNPSPPPPPIAPPVYPAYGQPKARRSIWFWIAIAGGCIVLCIPILLILAAVAIPSMLSAKKAASEISAIQTLRTIESAQVTYELAYPDHGYACSLPNLGGDTGPATADAAQLIDPVLAASGQKSGYTFTVTCGNKVNANKHDVYASYRATAVPQSVGKTGNRGFCADETAVIKFDPTGNTNCIQPIQ